MLARVPVADGDAPGAERGEEGEELDPFGAGAAEDDEHEEAPEAEDAENVDAELEGAKATLAVYQSYAEQSVARQKTLREWQRALAAAIAQSPERLKLTEIRALARAITNYRISLGAVRATLKRDDFRRLVDKFRANEAARARQMFETDAAAYVQAHKRGLDMALAAEDHRAIPSYTVPALDRIWPKKEDQAAQTPMVVLNIHPNQLATLQSAVQHLTEPADIIDVEAVE